MKPNRIAKLVIEHAKNGTFNVVLTKELPEYEDGPREYRASGGVSIQSALDTARGMALTCQEREYV